MALLQLKIITPSKIVIDEEVDSVTAPGADGEFTILPRHMRFLSLLREGVITIRKKKQEDHLAIGAGYLETDGQELSILVSRAYRQDEIDAKKTEEALKRAQAVLKESKDESQRVEATMMLRRSMVELKLLKKRHRSSVSPT